MRRGLGFNDAMIAEYIVSEPGSEINNTDSLVFFETEQGGQSPVA